MRMNLAQSVREPSSLGVAVVEAALMTLAELRGSLVVISSDNEDELGRVGLRTLESWDGCGGGCSDDSSGAAGLSCGNILR